MKDFKKNTAFDIIEALENLSILSVAYPILKADFNFKNSIAKLQLLKDEDGSYLLGNHYDEYKKLKQ